MATTKDMRDYVVERLSILGDITCRSMMGEYLLYYNGTLFGGIYDGRVLVKKVKTNEKYNMKEEIPYKGAKTMYMIEDLDNEDELRNIVLDTVAGLN